MNSTTNNDRMRSSKRSQDALPKMVDKKELPAIEPNWFVDAGGVRDFAESASESTIQFSGFTRRQRSIRLPAIFARRLHLLDLLRKASSLAIHLVLIRILSMAGFFVALWLCPVQIFASLGLYLASLSLATLAVFGRYELLVIAPRDERQCADAVYLCTIVATGIIAIALLIGVMINQLYGTPLGLYFAAALFIRAWLRLGQTFATRYGRYDRALKALFPHAIAQPFVLVFLVYHGWHPLIALILADIIGNIIAAGGVCISEWRSFYSSFRQPFRYRHSVKIARANFKLPTNNLTAAVSAFLFAISPLFFLPSLQNGILAGTLALLFRVLDVPASLMSMSLSPILMKDVADRNGDSTQQVPRSTLLLPATGAAVVFGLISLGSLALNSLDLIPNWHLALTMLPVVALFQASIAATSPLIEVATLADRQQGLLPVNVIAFAVAVSVFLLWPSDPVFAFLLAGSIGLMRVMAISAWLLLSNKYRILGSHPIA